MDAIISRSLAAYLRRRERLVKLPASTKAVTRAVFTETELQQLQLAEVSLNRLRGAQAIELLIANRSSLLGFIK